MTNYVYVIRADNGLYKIGSTSGLVERRLKALRTASPCELTVELVIAITDHVALEYALHERFACLRVRGEWFRLTSEDIEDLKREWDSVPGWDDLVRLQPPLAQLLLEARDYHFVARNDPDFCANHVWYGGDPSMKERLCRLVGWDVRGRNEPWKTLGSETSYDVAYDTVYEALPNCKHKGMC